MNHLLFAPFPRVFCSGLQRSEQHGGIISMPFGNSPSRWILVIGAIADQILRLGFDHVVAYRDAVLKKEAHSKLL
jgi:hypothetical protein